MPTSAIIKNNHIRFDGKDYFRGGAEDVQIGSYGEKKTPLFKANYLEVQSRLPPDKLRIRQAVDATIDVSKSDNFSVGVKAQAAGTIDGVPVEVSVDEKATMQRIREGHLRLVKLVMDNEDVRTAVNGTPEVLDRLRGYGPDARIVHQVFVVMDARLFQSLTASGSMTVSGSAEIDGIKITATQSVSAGTTRSTTVTLSRGSVFAYGLVAIDWNKSGLKKTNIKKLSDDQWGLN